MFNPENVVKELEAKGTIPVGKYCAAIISKSRDIIAVVTHEGKIGLLTIDGERRVIPKFNKVMKDNSGNYVCSAGDNGETHVETYDANLKCVCRYKISG